MKEALLQYVAIRQHRRRAAVHASCGLTVRICAALAITFAAGACANRDLSEPVIRRSTFIAGPGGVAMDPSSATLAPDGGFVVTGVSGPASTWAMKIDSNGNSLWRYDRPLDGEYRTAYSNPTLRSRIPPPTKYSGVVGMPDGSTFLCGSLSVAARQGQSAVLTHLGKSGEYLGETHLTPKGLPGPGVYTMGRCFMWGDELVVVGGCLDRGGSTFWIFALDQMGKLKWERRFAPLPPSQRSEAAAGANDQDRIAQQELMPWASTISVASTPSGAVMDILTSDRSNSELDAIDRDGQLVARRALFRSALLLPSREPRNDVTIQDFPKANRGAEIEILDSRFEAINTRPLRVRQLQYILGGYRLNDDSLFLFGGARGMGLIVPPAVAHVSQDLRSEKHAAVEVPGAMLGVNGVVAEPASMSQEYLIAVPVAKTTSMFHSPGNTVAVRPGMGIFLLDIK